MSRRKWTMVDAVLFGFCAWAVLMFAFIFTR